MIDETGGESSANNASDLAPVIPLFGTKTRGALRPASPSVNTEAAPNSPRVGAPVRAERVAADPGTVGDSAPAPFARKSARFTDADADSTSRRAERPEDRWAVPGLSDVPGGKASRFALDEPEGKSSAESGGAEVVSLFAARTRGVHFVESEADSAEQSPEEIRDAAAEKLVRKLRSRSLSVVEARAVLRAESVAAGHIDEVIDDFLRRGYLDDQVLAEQVVLSGVERKGQGRVALARSLAQRGIAREVIDAALEAVVDDDAERALEFARTKARTLSRLDFDTALRRLVGQLARRGYNGSVAMTAARTALYEVPSSSKPTSGVRFE